MGSYYEFDLQFQLMMDRFCIQLKDVLKENISSIIVCGSTVLGESAFDKECIDFVVVTKNDLSIEECDCIFQFHSNLRRGMLGRLGAQLQGVYCPIKMIKEPKSYKGKGYYIGIDKKKWKRIISSNITMIDYAIMKKYGNIFYGKDVRDEIYNPSYKEVKYEIISQFENNIDTSQKLISIDCSINLFYLGIRGMYTFIKNDFLSKNRACAWFTTTYPQSKWVHFVEYTSKFTHPLNRKKIKNINNKFIINNTPAFLQDIYEYLLKKSI
ncbi:hypothetical protein ACFIJ5_12760 [Haloimpatiens sp. FM7330]|uniref:hypothetical protein n=1 Tax=Haloimpatiens sp. FM7330 TaxID=3298610 RepID=UPI0036284E56